jgi:hypothetical protein
MQHALVISDENRGPEEKAAQTAGDQTEPSAAQFGRSGHAGGQECQARAGFDAAHRTDGHDNRGALGYG